MSELSLLLVDDDVTFCEVLGRALEKRQYLVSITHSVRAAEELLSSHNFDVAVVDLNMPEQTGLELIPSLVQRNPEIKVVVLTGFASIATAVEAIKLGATNYLTKPADADQIVAALTNTNTDLTSLPVKPMSTERLEWEHIQRVLTECDHNISKAARQLGMHRRTLQRKLQKRPSKLD